jgi:hypothetical protein
MRMMDQRWWTRIVESINARNNSLEPIVRLVELDVAVAVGAVAEMVMNEVWSVGVTGAVTIANPFAAQ